MALTDTAIRNLVFMIIHNICEILTAVGTVGAVIVALWLGLKDSKPNLQVSACVGINSRTQEEHLWISCANHGKQPVFCTSLVFIPNRFKKKGLRVMPDPRLMLSPLSVTLPHRLEYSDYLSQHFKEDFFQIRNEYPTLLSKYNWLARLCKRQMG